MTADASAMFVHVAPAHGALASSFAGSPAEFWQSLRLTTTQQTESPRDSPNAPMPRRCISLPHSLAVPRLLGPGCPSGCTSQRRQHTACAPATSIRVKRLVTPLLMGIATWPQFGILCRNASSSADWSQCIATSHQP
eukprot:5588181-Amphidinium_carterae.1